MQNTTLQHANHQARQSMRASIAKGLQSANPHLIPGQTCVVAAKNIRVELKKAFPKVKFSVKSESFSGGNAIRVSWTDGPTSAQVEEVADKYRAGRFDGMTDCYDYEFSFWCEAFGDAKYISTRREVTNQLVERVLAALAEKYGAIDDEPCPTVEAYRNGSLYGSPWQRLVNLAVTDAV